MKIDYVIGTVVGLAVSYFTVVMFMMGGGQFVYWAIAFLLCAHIGSFIFVEKRRNRENANFAVIALVSPPFVLWIGLFIFYQIASIFD